MAIFTPAKRVTAPLDDRAKDRLYNISSTTTISSVDHDTSSSGLLHVFFEDYDNKPLTDSDNECAVDDSFHVAQLIQDLLHQNKNPTRGLLLSHVADALRDLPPSRRLVVGRLRDVGYDAGLCEAQWEASVGLAAGRYEYIDIVLGSERYIVDVEFGEQFEVARATVEYGRVTESLPRVMVGKEKEVRQVVSAAAKAARRSMRRRGLTVPPWRRSRYMLAKWLGPYRRIVDVFPSSVEGNEVKCRDVGFRVAAGSVVFFPVGMTR